MSVEENKIQELNKLVIARIMTMPSNLGISIGSFGVIKKDDLVEHVRNNDEIGKKFAEMDLYFLQSMKNAEVLNEILEYAK